MVAVVAEAMLTSATEGAMVGAADGGARLQEEQVAVLRRLRLERRELRRLVVRRHQEADGGARAHRRRAHPTLARTRAPAAPTRSVKGRHAEQ